MGRYVYFNQDEHLGNLFERHYAHNNIILPIPCKLLDYQD